MEKGAQQSTYLSCEWLQESMQAMILEELLVMHTRSPHHSHGMKSFSMASHPAFMPIWPEG
jgi:hypothetical protein